MSVEDLNKNKLQELFPELYDELILNRWYLYCKDDSIGVAYYKGNGIYTVGVNSSYNIKMSSGWFVKGNTFRDPKYYELASVEEVYDLLEEGLRNKGYKFGNRVLYKDCIYYISLDITVRHNNVYIWASEVYGNSDIEIPIILNGNWANETNLL